MKKKNKTIRYNAQLKKLMEMHTTKLSNDRIAARAALKLISILVPKESQAYMIATTTLDQTEY